MPLSGITFRGWDVLRYRKVLRDGDFESNRMLTIISRISPPIAPQGGEDTPLSSNLSS